MNALWWSWVISAVVILVLTGAAGAAVRGSVLGVLVDSRGRCSLSRFHIVWWTTIILSLVTAVTIARFTVPGTDVFGFTIPGAVLGLLGVAAGTATASALVKSYKDRTRPHSISATPLAMSYLGQMLTLEEGSQADQTLDIGKLQSLIVTVILGLGYVLTCVHDFLGEGQAKVNGPADIVALPDLNPTFVALLAISGAHYVGMKAVPRDGQPTLSLPVRDNAEADRNLADLADGLPMDGKSIITRRKAAANAAREVSRRVAAQKSGFQAAAPKGAASPFPTT